MMDIPVDDQHPLRSMLPARVLGADGDAAEETESHRSIAQRMMAGRANGAEAPHGAAVESHVDCIEDSTRRRCRRVPRAFADDGVGIEATSSTPYDGAHVRDVFRIVYEGELVVVRMTSL